MEIGAAATRVLCLGNDLLGDDAFGPMVADALRRGEVPGVEIVETPETGMYLLDALIDCSRLMVVDTVVSGGEPPGTLYSLGEEDMPGVSGGSPHYVGVFEALEIGRAMGLTVPTEVRVLAVEGADCFTMGGEVHPAVRRVVPAVVDEIRSFVEKRS